MKVFTPWIHLPLSAPNSASNVLFQKEQNHNSIICMPGKTKRAIAFVWLNIFAKESRLFVFSSHCSGQAITSWCVTCPYCGTRGETESTKEGRNQQVVRLQPLPPSKPEIWKAASVRKQCAVRISTGEPRGELQRLRVRTCDVQDLYLEKGETLKKTQTDGKMHGAHKRAESILLTWSHHLRQPTGSMLSLLKYQWHCLQT